MSDLKTQPTDASVAAFLDGIEPERRRDEAPVGDADMPYRPQKK